MGEEKKIKDVTAQEQFKNVYSLFCSNLKLLRASTELSGVELAEKLDMSAKRINDLEGHRMPPTLDDLVAITHYFQITFDDLLNSKIGLSLKSKNL